MKRLSNIILKQFIALSMVAFAVMLTISYYSLNSSYIKTQKSQLEQILSIVVYDLEHKESASSVIKKIESSTNVIIDINSSNNINNKTLQSFKVIKENDKEYIYLTKELNYNNKRQLVTVWKALDNTKSYQSFLIKISLVYLSLLIVISYFVYRVSHKIGNETNKILDFLQELIEQKSSKTITSNFSYEFNSITKLLTTTSKELKKRAKKKSKYTAKLKLANKQKDEIISAISHEFKNPISVINGYSQTLTEDKNINPKIRDKFLDKIYTNANKLNDLIDRLRLFTKLEEYNQPLKFAKTDIVNLVQSAIEDIKQSYPSREINLISPQIVEKNIDKELFEIVIKNLVENALKYSEDTVTVTIDSTKLCVEDKGIGISQEDIEKVTKKFYRVSRNSWNNSLGIGLSIVKKVIKLHNFNLNIESKEQEGSKFCIIF